GRDDPVRAAHHGRGSFLLVLGLSLAAILRDAVALLGLLRMRSEGVARHRKRATNSVLILRSVAQRRVSKDGQNHNRCKGARPALATRSGARLERTLCTSNRTFGIAIEKSVKCHYRTWPALLVVRMLRKG